MALFVDERLENGEFRARLHGAGGAEENRAGFVETEAVEELTHPVKIRFFGAR